MSNPIPEEIGTTSTEFDETPPPACKCVEGAKSAYAASRKYVKENPIPVIAGAFALGLGLGYLLSQREEKEKDTAQAARELLDTAYSELRDKIPQLKQRYAETQSNIVEQAQALGSKLKWW